MLSKKSQSTRLLKTRKLLLMQSEEPIRLVAIAHRSHFHLIEWHIYFIEFLELSRFCSSSFSQAYHS